MAGAVCWYQVCREQKLQNCGDWGGVVGTNAAKMAVGLGADVTIFDRSLPVRLSDIFGASVATRFYP